MTLLLTESVIFSLYRKRRLLLYEVSPLDGAFLLSKIKTTAIKPSLNTIQIDFL